MRECFNVLNENSVLRLTNPLMIQKGLFILMHQIPSLLLVSLYTHKQLFKMKISEQCQQI